jgi:hypothetical protein
MRKISSCNNLRTVFEIFMAVTIEVLSSGMGSYLVYYIVTNASEEPAASTSTVIFYFLGRREWGPPKHF